MFGARVFVVLALVAAVAVYASDDSCFIVVQGNQNNASVYQMNLDGSDPMRVSSSKCPDYTGQGWAFVNNSAWMTVGMHHARSSTDEVDIYSGTTFDIGTGDMIGSLLLSEYVEFQSNIGGWPIVVPDRHDRFYYQVDVADSSEWIIYGYNGTGAQQIADITGMTEANAYFLVSGANSLTYIQANGLMNGTAWVITYNPDWSQIIGNVSLDGLPGATDGFNCFAHMIDHRRGSATLLCQNNDEQGIFLYRVESLYKQGAVVDVTSGDTGAINKIVYAMNDGVHWFILSNVGGEGPYISRLANDGTEFLQFGPLLLFDDEQATPVAIYCQPNDI